MSVSLTALGTITSALRVLGVVRPGETLSGPKAADALGIANAFLDSLATEHLTIPAIARDVFDLTAFQQTYRIGPGATWNIPRPERIDGAGRIMNTSPEPNETPLAILSDEAYRAIPIKTQTNVFPTALWYNPTIADGWGTVFLWPNPTDATYDIAIYTQTALAQFATLTTVYIMAPGYARMLRYNLALELAPDFGVEVPAVVAMHAAQSMAAIKRVNMRPVDLPVDPAFATNRRQWYNIQTGTGG